MPLYKQPESDNWWCRFSIRGVKTRRSTGTTDRCAAEDFETKLRSDLYRQLRLGERPRYTFDDAVRRWKELADGRDKARDEERLKWFEQYLAGVALVDIDRELIEKCRAVRAAESSQATANRYMACLRMLLRRAHREWDWIDKAPVVPMFSIEKREARFLTRSQARQVLKELRSRSSHLADVAEVALETGMRMSNVTGLSWPQVDLRRRQLIVPASRSKAGETIAVPLSSRALAILKAQRGEHPEHVFTYRKGPKRSSRALPFHDANGRIFKAATAAAGVPWLRFHDLRHTWASWHVQDGTPLQALQELGGWKSFAMVQNYAHLSTDHLRQFVDKRGRKRA